jgi:trimethylamine--corrinoid protein Co-methyltransferase
MVKTRIQVLSEDERYQIHERSLRVLANTGARVDTAQGRRILRDAGAEVDERSHIVRFPRSLVEESLRLAPRKFALGARRPGWDLPMNRGSCTLLIDGEARFVLDRHTGQRRPGTFEDWLQATRLIDALDDIGVYWAMVEASDHGDTAADYVAYLRALFGNFSKHVQDSLSRPELAPWLLEVLQVIFGDRQAIRQQRPLSFLLCPQSPLVIAGPHTDAYLALAGWDIPVAIMPMPLRGATAPGSLIATAVVGNCEVLAMLCLIQAAAPGTPVLYAPCLATIDPRSGRYSGGAIEGGLGGAATTEMARTYGLPAEASGIGTDQYVPGIQAAYERALNGLLTTLSWPDILVGPGLLGGSMVLSLAQLLIDTEIFRLGRRAFQGIEAGDENWLEEEIERIGPGGGFLAERSTVERVRGVGWYVSQVGVHEAYESWEAEGRPRLLESARQRVDEILATHQPLRLEVEVERELEQIEKRAQKSLET